MRDKTKRLRGSTSHGRGWKNSKHKAGARGGTGRAGLEDHKKITAVLQVKNFKRKVTNIRDIQCKLDRYIAKGFIVKKVIQSENGLQPQYHFKKKFLKKYSKILSQGEPSGKYVYHRNLKFSKTALKKLM